MDDNEFNSGSSISDGVTGTNDYNESFVIGSGDFDELYTDKKFLDEENSTEIGRVNPNRRSINMINIHKLCGGIKVRSQRSEWNEPKDLEIGVEFYGKKGPRKNLVNDKSQPIVAIPNYQKNYRMDRRVFERNSSVVSDTDFMLNNSRLI